MVKRGYNPNELFHFLTWFILRSQGAEYQNKSWHEFRPTSFRQKSIRLCCYLLFVGNNFEWNAVQNVIKYKLKYELIFSLFYVTPCSGTFTIRCKGKTTSEHQSVLANLSAV